MRYIITILLALSLPAMALESNLSDLKQNGSNARILQMKIQQKVKRGDICAPDKATHLPYFN